MAPFKSEAQRRYLFAKEPALAKRWAKKYGTPKHLPLHAKKSTKVKILSRTVNGRP